MRGKTFLHSSERVFFFNITGLYLDYFQRDDENLSRALGISFMKVKI